MAGPIREACVVVADVATARVRLAAALGWAVGPEPVGFNASRARLWGRPGLAGAPSCVLAPPSGQGGAIRLIQGTSGAAGPAPYRRIGWSAIELQVADSTAAVRRAEAAGLRVLGAPGTIGDGGSLPIRAGQVADDDGLILYLTQITGPVTGFELPRIRGDTDGIFIAVLNTADLETARDAIERRLGTTRSSDRRSPIGVVNATVGLPPQTRHRLSSQQLRGGNLLEIDELAVEHEAAVDPPPTGVLAVSVRSADAGRTVFEPCPGAILELDGRESGGWRN
jgi:hypothetical protein